MIRLAALFGVVAISFSAVFVSLADVSPSTSAFFRMAYALPLLVVMTVIVRRRDTRSRKVRLMALGSGLFLAMDLSIWHWSIGLIGVGLATVLANTQVVFVGVIGWKLLGERPSRQALVMVPLILAGVALASGLGRPDAYGADPVLGTVLAIITGLLYAVFLVTFRACNREKVPSAGPLQDATFGAAVGCMLVGLLDPGFSFVPSWPAHGWLIALALGSQVVGWLLIATALPRLPALETSVLLLLQPVLAVIWGLIIFSELLSIVQWLGVLFVLGGIGVLSLTGGAARPGHSRPRDS